MTDSVQKVMNVAETFLPSYLTPAQKEDLVSELRKFPNIVNYYLSSGFEDEALQGDVWSNFEIIKFDSGDRRTCSGIILSNSCDISPDNERHLPVNNVLFAPLLSLDRLKKFLSENKVPVAKIESIFQGIKSQSNTSTFFLPGMPGVIEDSVVLLSDVHIVPASYFKENCKKSLTLSMHGFYIFLIKLSIHFCRFNERVFRF
ncbi:MULTISPECIES: hypothetical protein [Marinobacter]|uniref:hypothetical protein n=1 Tax=Marinobacter TaxID=2742 RepID=UPI001E61C8A5|nr:hypothetical protein [Marinobacter shengliensis]MCD1631562.1 hypothetical protein [Marinobacter shengliensis]